MRPRSDERPWVRWECREKDRAMSVDTTRKAGSMGRSIDRVFDELFCESREEAVRIICKAGLNRDAKASTARLDKRWGNKSGRELLRNWCEVGFGESVHNE